LTISVDDVCKAYEGNHAMSAASELQSLVKNRHKPKDKPADTKVAMVFLAPWLIGAIVLSLIPMLYSLGISFTKYTT